MSYQWQQPVCLQEPDGEWLVYLHEGPRKYSDSRARWAINVAREVIGTLHNGHPVWGSTVFDPPGFDTQPWFVVNVAAAAKREESA